MGELVLETVKLRKTYETNAGKVYALSGVDLQARRGDFVAIMGPSGSGKTTLLNLIGCLDKPTSGKVILDGVDITDMPEGSLHEIRREKIGFVFQSFNLIQNLSALENVELPMESLGVLKKRRRKRARNLLHLVGLQKRGKHRPAQLSAGEQQRVAIARALANEPTIVLADEPTGNVDQKTSLSIIKLLSLIHI